MAVTRKTVTVLFADVADSTALGERLDPETLRAALARWFEEARVVIERHGGTVEKYIGDSVMAVFGVPQLHEDDAARAVRAADELRKRLASLNAEFERTRGLALAVRVAVNTGEVVAGDEGGPLVTGDAVNVAKRLEEATPPGDVLVGETTARLVRACARLEPVEPVAAKGKSQPVRALRLVEVDPEAATFERRFDTPLVGRRRELEHLQRAYRRSVSERTCCLFTLLGPAGIGKTRLACELFEELAEEATVLTGRCLPYGEGITFWPLQDVIAELGGEERVMALLAEEDDAQLICERLAGSAGSQETFWAVRRLCETLASRRPLILCFEDVHWAEPTFLDLIEYLAGWIRDSPILLLCVARPEFLDERPSWLSGQENAASLTLSSLSAPEARKLLDFLGMSGDARTRIAEASEGNPLYVEQMAAMVAEGGYAEELFSIPPTIHALLAARLDRLTQNERTVIERAAVCGKVFWRDAIVQLMPEDKRDGTGSVLMSLVRKELIRPHRSASRPDDAFRFGHVLIRDAAYAAVPKKSRATLHERFAEWIQASEGTRALELEEITGYHLEQAVVYREQLGPADEHVRELSTRAGRLLANAGDRAFTRSDMPAAVNLLARATTLLDEGDPARLQALPELASALMATGDFSRADSVLSQTLELAAASRDKRLELRTLIEREFFRAFTNPESSTEDIVHVAETAIPLLEDLGDDLGLAKAWWLRSEADVIAGRWADRGASLERALIYARRSKDTRGTATIIALLAQALEYGPTPVLDAIERCEALRAERPDEPAVQAALEFTLSALRAMIGEFDRARELYLGAQAKYADLGLRYMRAVRSLVPASVELLAGDPDAAVHELRAGYDALEEMGERGTRSTIAAFLAQALVVVGNYSEAEKYTRISEETSAEADVVNQAVWRSARSRCLAHAGDAELAEHLAVEAVELAELTDFLALQASTLLELSEVRKITRPSESVTPLVEAARERYERKGNLVAARRAAALLAEPVR